MDDGQPPEGQGHGEDSAQPADELAARRHAKQQSLPIDQRALNIIGLAQARTYLQAGRAATLKVGRRCRSCGSDIADVEPNGPHLTATCAECGEYSYNVPRKELGLPRRGVSDPPPDQSPRRQASTRHPSARVRAHKPAGSDR